MKRKKILTLILVLAIMLAGCSQAGANLEAADAEPMVFEAGDENFAIKTYINKLEFDEGEEIKLHSTIEYIGQNESIAIWSGEPYFHHLIHDGDKYINSDIVLGILKETVLKKGEVYTIPFPKAVGSPGRPGCGVLGEVLLGERAEAAHRGLHLYGGNGFLPGHGPGGKSNVKNRV